MRHTPHFVMTDPEEVKRLIRENPWATFVSPTAGGLIASHYPALLDEDAREGITILSHFGRPDDVAHELGQHEVLVIIQDRTTMCPRVGTNLATSWLHGII